ncbi:heat shock 70 kDa protein 14 isoform X3 [Pseudorca crassidens]|uniref:heat shock 70 kDa protein 14 isoform X3 n=1 Tax=Pseudorca crassidens TaxID=82174 RepID=UPI00352C4EFC
MATSNSSAGIRWSRQETRTLLSILGEAEYIQRLQTVHHNADVYQAVSKRMQQEGFRRTERQCRSKFKVLKALYLKAYVAHATSMGDPPHCPFYDTLDQLLRNQIVTDADNVMEDAAWAKHCDRNLAAPDAPGEEGASILGAKRTQAADHQPVLKTVKESDEDCQLRISDQMRETSDLEDSWDESSGAGCSQGTPSYSSSHHLFRGTAAPCQSSPVTRLGVSGEPSPCTSSSRNTPGVASAQRPPGSSSRVPFVSGGDGPLTSEPPPRWARRRRRSVARTIAAELAENRRLARELSKREEEKLDRLIAIGEEASAQQDTANELRRDAVVAVRRLATAVEEATGAFQLGLEKLLQSSDDPQAQKYIRDKTAHSVLGSDANDVVITVPFDFGEKQKNALGEAARAAGFNVLRLIHEPSAALLAYGIGQDSPTGKSNILVFKLGGTSLSISVMEVNSGIYRVLSTNTDNNIGGTHFTETLAQYLASEFQRSFKHDVRGNARAMVKLMNSADTAKHSLSTLGSANCFLDSLYKGQDFDCNVSRARFELLCSPLFNKCIEAIRELLEQSGFTADDINKFESFYIFTILLYAVRWKLHFFVFWWRFSLQSSSVVLCGGSSRIPRLQQMIKDLFPAVELLNSVPPDEVIPIGAAMEAGILIGKENLLVEDALKIECSAKDILVKGVDESGANSFKVLFPSGTPLPARRQHTLQAPGSISSVCLELYESEGKNSAKEENKFAQVVLQDLDKKENGLRDILAVLTMKRDGSLHVTCTDQETGKCEAITIEVAS